MGSPIVALVKTTQITFHSVFLFTYSLFNDVLSSSDYIVLNDAMINK
jgi:hypothetical protein